MPKVDSVVAIYDTHEQAEQAIKELQEGGVDMKSCQSQRRICTRMNMSSVTTTPATG